MAHIPVVWQHVARLHVRWFHVPQVKRARQAKIVSGHKPSHGLRQLWGDKPLPPPPPGPHPLGTVPYWPPWAGPPVDAALARGQFIKERAYEGLSLPAHGFSEFSSPPTSPWWSPEILRLCHEAEDEEREIKHSFALRHRPRYREGITAADAARIGAGPGQAALAAKEYTLSILTHDFLAAWINRPLQEVALWGTRDDPRIFVQRDDSHSGGWGGTTADTWGSAAVWGDDGAPWGSSSTAAWGDGAAPQGAPWPLLPLPPLPLPPAVRHRWWPPVYGYHCMGAVFWLPRVVGWRERRFHQRFAWLCCLERTYKKSLHWPSYFWNRAYRTSSAYERNDRDPPTPPVNGRRSVCWTSHLDRRAGKMPIYIQFHLGIDTTPKWARIGQIRRDTKKLYASHYVIYRNGPNLTKLFKSRHFEETQTFLTLEEIHVAHILVRIDPLMLTANYFDPIPVLGALISRLKYASMLEGLNAHIHVRKYFVRAMGGGIFFCWAGRPGTGGPTMPQRELLELLLAEYSTKNDPSKRPPPEFFDECARVLIKKFGDCKAPSSETQHHYFTGIRGVHRAACPPFSWFTPGGTAVRKGSYLRVGIDNWLIYSYGGNLGGGLGRRSGKNRPASPARAKASEHAQIMEASELSLQIIINVIGELSIIDEEEMFRMEKEA
ncbi:hypothetical protein B0H14DRAFT_2564890 [Mycena olivaceomarginata]|nr:hypothetical protein B0H14DRAFT_2564890 [Mycena olivaceomarginata]